MDPLKSRLIAFRALSPPAGLAMTLPRYLFYFSSADALPARARPSRPAAEA